jgi:predicted molibdopterin-dependent oxidoreductase YjgC
LPLEDLTLFKSIFADSLDAGLVTSLEEGKPTASLAAMADKIGKPFEADLTALKDTDAVLSLELDLVGEHQVAGFFVKRQLLEGTQLFVADDTDNRLVNHASGTMKLVSGEETQFLLKLLKALDEGSEDESLNKAANALKNAEKPCIVYGATFAENADEGALEALLKLAEELNAALIGVKGNANSMAAAQLALEAPFKADGFEAAFLLLGDEEPTQKLTKAMEEIPFVVAQAAYSSQLTGAADVVLPVTMWAEQSGTYLSLDGRLQTAIKSLEAPEGVLSSREALLKMAEKLSIEPNTDWKTSLKARIPTVAIHEA